MARTKYRRIRKDQVVGDVTINELYDNDKALDQAISTKLDEGGAFRTREVSQVRGNYELSVDGTKYTLVRQTAAGFLPAEIPTAVAGEIVINFAKVLPEPTYDVTLTAGFDFDYFPGRIGYDHRATGKTPDFLLVRMRNNGGGAENLRAFSVAISFGD